MAENAADYFKRINGELDRLDGRSVTTKVVVNEAEIQRRIEEKMKRGMTGRSTESYGV